MKNLILPVVAAIALCTISVGYAATDNEDQTVESIPSTAAECSDMQMMKKGAMDHQMNHQKKAHMMHSMMNPGVSPVTIVINPGTMPVMETKMAQHKSKGDSAGHSKKMEKMQKHRMMAMEKMQSIEQRLEKIETLLEKLVELQEQE